MTELISLADARAQGLRYFCNGKPCKRGEVARRLVSDRHCTCHLCHADKQSREGEKKKLTRAANAAAYQERSRKWIAENPERHRSNKTNWRVTNGAKVTSMHHKRRARKLDATPSWFGELDQFVMLEAADLCRLREIITGVKWQVDHMIPLQAKLACGLHCAANLQVIPASLNQAKKNRMVLTKPFEWMPKNV